MIAPAPTTPALATASHHHRGSESTARNTDVEPTLRAPSAATVTSAPRRTPRSTEPAASTRTVRRAITAAKMNTGAIHANITGSITAYSAGDSHGELLQSRAAGTKNAATITTSDKNVV